MKFLTKQFLVKDFIGLIFKLNGIVSFKALVQVWALSPIQKRKWEVLKRKWVMVEEHGLYKDRPQEREQDESRTMVASSEGKALYRFVSAVTAKFS